MFQELKVDTRRIPNRHGEIEEVAEAPQPEPAPEPAPAPAPEPIAIAPEPTPLAPEPPKPARVKRRIKRPVVKTPEPVVEEAVVEQLPVEPALSEVEYWWDSSPQVANGNGDRHSASADWFPEPVIHPERW
jgi:hypothetical protein